MPLILYRSDKTTLLDGFSITNENAGTDSDPVDLWVMNTGTTVARNVLLVQQTADPTDLTVGRSSGVPPQDEMWGRIKITDKDSTGDPTFTVVLTDYIPMGAFGGLKIGDIPAGCGVKCRYLSHPPSSAADDMAWTRWLRPVFDEWSQPVPQALGKLDHGVLTGIGDPSRSGCISIFYFLRDCKTADIRFPSPTSGFPGGPDDDKLWVPGGWTLVKGRLHTVVGGQIAFNQNDSASSALTSGQYYWAAISAGPTGHTATKGLRGTAPDKPSPPVGEVLLGYVKVRYSATTTVITSTDISWLTPDYFDRYMPSDGGGLNLAISPGEAIAGGTWRFSASHQIVPLANNATSYVWQLASGRFTATLTDEYPETTALPICLATTVSGAITVITDRRVFAGDIVHLTGLRGAPPGSSGTSGVGSIKKIHVPHEHLIIDANGLVAWASDNGGGSAGNEILDIKLNGTSLFPSFATEDWRPAFSHTGSDLVHPWALPEAVDLYAGDILELLNVENPTGGKPAEVGVELLCRKA